MIKITENFDPVLWILLTDTNETNWERLELDAGKFLQGLSRITKCHIRAPGGIEKSRNTHAHIIVEVPNSEIDRFSSRYARFRPKDFWKRRKFDIRPWKDGFKTREYTMCKHSLWYDSYCPGYYRSCRKGKCEIF